MNNKQNYENVTPNTSAPEQDNNPVPQQNQHQYQNQQPNQMPYYTQDQGYTRVDRYEGNRKPWYNQGWVWLIVAVLGIGVIFFGLAGLTAETANVNNSIQEQTAAIQDQSQILQSIRDGMNSIVVAIKDAVIAIQDSMNKI